MSVIRVLRSNLRTNAKNSNVEANNVIEVLSQSFGGLKDVILNGLNSRAVMAFAEADFKYRRSIYGNQVFSIAPRYVIETIFIILILLSALYGSSLTTGEPVSIAALGSFAYVVQRLLPMFQGIYSSMTLVRGSKDSASDIMQHHDSARRLKNTQNEKLQVLSDDIIDLKEKLSFRDVSFRYANDKDYVLKDVNLDLYKGDIVGIVGRSGEGKSTFVNLLTGLFRPTTGLVMIDENHLDEKLTRRWMFSIAYVPQDIFILNGRLQDNLFIKFKNKALSLVEVKQAMGLNFIPTEDFYISNQSLSGGQKQRVGIARAYIKDVPLVVLDEATSAMDKALEKEVMKNLLAKFQGALVIIVTHSLDQLHYCNKIIEVSDQNAKVTNNVNRQLNSK